MADLLRHAKSTAIGQPTDSSKILNSKAQLHRGQRWFRPVRRDRQLLAMPFTSQLLRRKGWALRHISTGSKLPNQNRSLKYSGLTKKNHQAMTPVGVDKTEFASKSSPRSKLLGPLAECA